MSSEAGPGGNFSPENFPQAELLVADFDGTTHNTFESPDGGVDVDEAYRIGIVRVFDFDKDALMRYEAGGGHRNRTPAEIVHELAPKSTPEGLQRLTEELVEVKLELLLEQIGKPIDGGERWPRPMPGFIDFWDSVQKARDQGRDITTAIISAGHAPFIDRVFEESGLEEPDIMVTDETIRGLNSPLPPDKLAKPSVMPLSLAKIQWLNLYGLDIPSEEVDPPIGGRITLFGDSLEKDGGLATNGGVHFVHISPENPAAGYEELSRHLELGQAALKQTVRHGAQ